MVDRDVLALLERDAVHLRGGEEDPVLEDAFEIEVGPDLRLVEVVLGLAHLLRVEVPVRRGDLEAALRGVDLLLDRGRLAARLRGRRRHEAGQQLLRVRRRLRHLVVEHVVRPRREPEELRLLGPQSRQLHDRGLRVVGPAVVAARHRGREDALAEGAVLERGERRLLGRVLHAEEPFPVQLLLLRGVGGRGEVAFRQAGEVGLPVHDDGGGVRVGEELVGVLRRQGGELFVELREPGLVGGAEVGAGAHEEEAVALDEVLRLRVEPERVALVVDRLDAGVELRVHVDRVVVGRDLRRELGLDLLERLVRIRLLDVEKTLYARVKSSPERSIASIVFAKVGGSGLSAIAAISASCCFMPSSIAGW